MKLSVSSLCLLLLILVYYIIIVFNRLLASKDHEPSDELNPLRNYLIERNFTIILEPQRQVFNNILEIYDINRNLFI